MYLNKLYRSDKYCEISLCEDFKYGCSNLPCGYQGPIPKVIHNQIINCNSDEKLSCGCPAFESYSHNKDCELFNLNESFFTFDI